MGSEVERELAKAVMALVVEIHMRGDTSGAFRLELKNIDLNAIHDAAMASEEDGDEE